MSGENYGLASAEWRPPSVGPTEGSPARSGIGAL